MALSASEVEQAIAEVVDPFNRTALGEAKAIRDVAIDGDHVSVKLLLGYPSKALAGEVAQAVRDRVGSLSGCDEVTVELSHKIVAHAAQQGVQSLDGVSNIIAIASGKGGVGKSTTAVNLALALTKEGARVGILDADIYGPSQPQMLGSEERPQLVAGDEKRITPISSLGVQSMSIGYLIEKDTAMIWRGPMATQALEQLFRDTAWDDVDYLIVDLPPGTGDIHLTLAQRLPVTGAIIVTTPQDIALLDAVKALKMFEKVKVPVMGIVENMSTHICSHCGHEEHIFGEEGGARMAREHGLTLLGSLPLDIRIRQQADGGTPTVVADPDGPLALAYREIALRATAHLALRDKDYARKFPNISVVND